jgi:hypothetical protein
MTVLKPVVKAVLKAAAVLGLGAMAAMAALVPEATAADLAVERTRVHHYRARVVRDYDGTAVVERRVRIVQRLPDGTLAVAWRDEMIPAMRATPRNYLNGQPVLPSGPRSPLRVVVTRYR